MVNPDRASLPLTVRRELSLISHSLGVQENSVVIDVADAGGPVQISFVIETETLVEPTNAGIQAVEPFTFAYDSVASVGVCAPVIVSGREDFPRNLGHLNPVLPGRPASLCLARAGLQPIIDRYGIEGVMARLRSWLRDAQTNALMADGWEPVPLAANTQVRHGLIDADVFQDYAAQRSQAHGTSFGVAKVTPLSDEIFVAIEDQALLAEAPAHDSQLCKAIRRLNADEGKALWVPWIFAWPSRDNVVTDPLFGDWDTFEQLQTGLATIGMSDPVDIGIGSILANGCTCQHLSFPRSQVLVVVVGVWRPVALHSNIFGLSQDNAARRLELKAYILESRPHDKVLDKATHLRAIIADPRPSSALYRAVANVPKLPPVGLLGYGSLGEAIANQLLRSGSDSIYCIDRDRFMPHNFARHSAGISDIYDRKVSHLQRKADALAPNGLQPRITTTFADITALRDDELRTAIGDARVVVDATADERVRGRAAELHRMENRQVIRVEIFHHGRLGVQFVASPNGNPSLIDLYYLLCLQALHDDEVYQWLHDEHAGGADSEDMRFGFGCASRTTRMPSYVVAQHASAFMPMIINALVEQSAPGIGINCLDKDFRPSGWKWVAADAMKQWNMDATAPGWTVSMEPQAIVEMMNAREKALPRETGGYLYGGWDPNLRKIVVLAASPLPPGSTPSATSLALGPAGGTAMERRLLRRTRGRLSLVGTWHSHPGESAAMSPKDTATLQAFAKVDAEYGVPTLLVIVAGAGDVQVHLCV